jgi:hypothetical protein
MISIFLIFLSLFCGFFAKMLIHQQNEIDKKAIIYPVLPTQGRRVDTQDFFELMDKYAAEFGDE